MTQKEIERLLIVGNGFDLKCGLKSKFEDYYTNYSEIKTELSDISISIDAFQNNDKRTLCQIITRIDKQFCETSENFEKIKTIKFKKISFWEYYLYKNKDSIHDWADVEKQLQKFFLDENQSINTCLIKQFNLLKDIHSQKKTINLDKSFNFENTNQTILELIFALIYNFNYNISSHSEKYFYDFLFDELNKFEENFNTYLKSIITNSYKDCSQQLLEKLAHNEHYNLLSFNYTSPCTESTPCNMVRNIHSKLGNNPIIGIDSKGIDPTSPIFRFTKTYRIMTLANNKQDKLLPKTIKTIAFYGHSLAPADYSYFQSIFDYYNIYDNDITLVFYYSIYDENNEQDIKRTQFNSVSRLISQYGATFKNEKGQNLMHKMLLESRLILKKIEVVKNVNKLTPKSLNLSTTNLKMHGSNWGTYALITAGITTASIAGIAFYKKCKTKKLEKAREKELNQLGFEFIDNSNSET